MPTEVTVAPFKLSQQFPISFEHPVSYSRMFPNTQNNQYRAVHPEQMGYHHQPHHHQHQQQPFQPSPSFHAHQPPLLPPSLPRPPVYPISHSGIGIPASGGMMRVQECLPNKVLPNGLRNPWSAYTGETYIPGCEKADRMALDQVGGGVGGGGKLQIGSVPIPIPITHSLARAQRPRSVYSNQGWMAGSLISASMSNPASHLGGRRVDEGWDGSQGRAHLGHLPDPTSTAGRLGRSGSGSMMDGGGGANWRQAPSSWQNHARLTPSLIPTPTPGPEALSVSQTVSGGEYMQPGKKRVDQDQTRPRRASFAVPPEECMSCTGGLRRSGSGRSSGSVGGRHPSRLRDGSPAVESPLRRAERLADEGLQRRGSGSSRHNGR